MSNLNLPSDSPNEKLHITQNVNGDRTQTISKMVGGIVVNHLVIYYNSAVEADSPKAEPEAAEIGPNPYKGLLAFHETDGDRFFGRDLQIQELWERFRRLHENESAVRLLPIYGPSGSGKSSLARAGLIPELVRRPLPGRDRARVAVLFPTSHPLDELATVLAKIATNEPYPAKETFDKFKEYLTSKNTDSKYHGLRTIVGMMPNIDVSPLIVLVDQLEEVYTLCEDEDERDAFIGNLLCASSERPNRVSAIITLRSDFLAATQKHPSLNQLLEDKDRRFLVPQMSLVELRDAICKPAKQAGYDLGEPTVNLLIEQTVGREGALPLLQVALTKIWEGRQEHKNPADTLRDIGGVGGALAGEADRIYQGLNPEKQDIARRIFLGLVHLGEGVKDTRRRTDLQNLVSHRNSLKQVKQVIYLFSDRKVRLITLTHDDNAEKAEMTHEILIDRWDCLKDWLDKGRNDLRFQQRLNEAAIVWKEQGRQKGSLWRSPNLDLLQKYHKEHGDDMTELQIEFMDASKQSARGKKLIEISKYFILGGVLGTFATAAILFYIIKHTDFEYIWAKQQNEYTYFISTLKSKSDKRNNYVYDLLLLVLMEAYPKQKDKIEIKTRKIDPGQVNMMNALNRGQTELTNRSNQVKINIVWTMQTIDRSTIARKIFVDGENFSATLGLLSHRLCLISNSKINNKDISAIKDRKLFEKSINVTQVRDWPDSDFLRSHMKNGLNETEKYAESKEQLLNPKNKVNCFLRGVSEVYIEKDIFLRENHPKVSVANNFFYQYYSPDVFYVSKDNEELAKAMEQGIKKSLKSGQFLCVYRNHYDDFIRKADLTEEKKISLDGPNVKRSKYYLDFTDKDMFKNIVDMEETHMPKDGPECKALIKKLNDRNKHLNS